MGDTDLDRRVLFVRQAATFTGREVTFDRPKSRDSERPVPMPPSSSKSCAQRSMTRRSVGFASGKDGGTWIWSPTTETAPQCIPSD
jgi:hypothetical protein